MRLIGGLTRIRRWLLAAMFQLLYTRLGFLHETAGRVVFGEAWDGRRRHIVSSEAGETLLDVGCGEGRLLRTIGCQSGLAFGVEPSPVMARRARCRRVAVVQATAQAVPLASGSIDRVVATYPGPWIVDQRTWDEIARVTRPGGTVTILLGGDIKRGRGASVRSWLLRLAYGNESATAAEELPPLGGDQVTGEYAVIEDRWGTAIVWSGRRAADATGQADTRARTEP